MALTAEVSAAASSKLLATSTAKKTEKFQTLQRTQLNEEMLVWISDKNRLQGEVDQLKNEKSNAEELAEELKQSLAASATQVTTPGLTLQSKVREIEQLAGEKALLIASRIPSPPAPRTRAAMPHLHQVQQRLDPDRSAGMSARAWQQADKLMQASRGRTTRVRID